MARSKNSPTDLLIRSYNVGFGDCHLLSFDYPGRRRTRHVLIDFGSKRLPTNKVSNHMVRIAKEIQNDCKGKLDALVVTHRHQDHISGFATRSNGKGPGDVIRALKPDVVIQPWTEHPRLQTDAIALPAAGSDRGFSQRLINMQHFAESLPRQLAALKRMRPADRARLRIIGENNISNKSAVRNLHAMAQQSALGKGVFVHTGRSAQLGSRLGGVKVHVMGPPTIKQSDEVLEQSHKNKDEFWHMHSDFQYDDVAAEKLFDKAKTRRTGADNVWFTGQLQKLRGVQLRQIVRIMDDALNNTSIILLFQIGTKSFLFPGDAQWENWAYALNTPRYKKLLRSVDVYKVGHHGSLNATPKSLWNSFSQKGDKTKKNRLKTLLSSKSGVYGSTTRKTEVPRRTLVKELDKQSELHQTSEVRVGQLKIEIPLKL